MLSYSQGHISHRYGGICGFQTNEIEGARVPAKFFSVGLATMVPDQSSAGFGDTKMVRVSTSCLGGGSVPENRQKLEIPLGWQRRKCRLVDI